VIGTSVRNTESKKTQLRIEMASARARRKKTGRGGCNWNDDETVKEAKSEKAKREMKPAGIGARE